MVGRRRRRVCSMSGVKELAKDLWARALLDTPECEDWWDTCLAVRDFSIDESDTVLCALEDLADVVETLAFSDPGGDDRLPVSQVDATTTAGALRTVSDFRTYRHVDIDGMPIIVWADARPTKRPWCCCWRPATAPMPWSTNSLTASSKPCAARQPSDAGHHPFS
jgi:hypothetical protein